MRLGAQADNNAANMKTAKAGDFLNDRDYRIEQGYDVFRHAELVVLMMDNGPAVVSEAQWEAACATTITRPDGETPDGDELDAIWDALMEQDIAGTEQGRKAIAAIRDELAE
jgi:hypothetical protein